MDYQIRQPCFGHNVSPHNFLGLAKLFYNDRFDAFKDGYALAICPWLNSFGKAGFHEAFKPINIDEGDRWFENDHDIYNPWPNKPSTELCKRIEEVNDHRVFSLLFMHELHKDYLENFCSDD
jgi:hypothetical protein